MRPSLPIGDFSQATHLSIKTLRYYHRVGLLEPADVDPATGHRRYSTDQIPTAQVIRRFRALDMPVDQIAAVLHAPDLDTRSSLITAHLDRLEDDLVRTQDAVSSLRDLLQPEEQRARISFEHRAIPATPAAAISQVVDISDIALWFEGAFGELYAALSAQGADPTGTGGGVYSRELFTDERGLATVFVPCDGPLRPAGRVDTLVVPPVELAVAVHAGGYDSADRTYGALATYVADHALGVDGPIREYYLVGRRNTSDEAQWRTEIGWPIFRLGTGQTSPWEGTDGE